MALTFSDPFSALFNLQRALDSRRTSDWLGGSTAGMGAYPPINVFQQGDDFVAIIELPGIDKSELNIQAMQNRIRVSGKKAVDYAEGASVHRRERVSGVFDRTLSMPVNIDADNIKAEYKNGILAVFIPRAASEKPRSIAIG